MSRWETVSATYSHSTHGEDRVAVVQDEERTIIVVADGAGGSGNGAAAAETVIREVQAVYREIATAGQWEAALRQMDLRIGSGETTAVVADLRADAILGASVGDSRVWIIREGSIFEPTIHQHRKPLLGSGQAVPVGFTCGPLDGILLAASDGFTNYVDRQRLVDMLAGTEFVEIPRRCVDLVRLRSGELWDDVAIVACRTRPPQRRRQRYVI
jgi:PPM family protein phosphatase